MKKQDKINLDALSGIKEEIVDEVTDKRIALLKRVGKLAAMGRKKLMAIGSIAAGFVLVFSLLFAILIPLMGTDVPVYQGMTIRKEPRSSLEVQEYRSSDNGILPLRVKGGSGSGIEFVGKSNGNPNGNQSGNPNGVANGHHKDKDHRPKKDIEDIVTIDVLTDDEVKYYVEPGATIIIEIHIDNPKNYEIQSFTLNNQKYANYMFKEGSTMELLLLEVTAPSNPGYVEYTIDAIKYIDGTEIKDVDMSSGDKSVRAGIAYPTAPSATVTSQSISTTSINLTIEVSDPYSRIGDSALTVYLSDGERIVGEKPLWVGENTVVFEDLIMNKTYEYGVVTSFDMVDGRDLHEEWLLTNTIMTAGAFGISNAESTQSTITFTVDKIGEVGTITAISLYDAAEDKLVEAGGADKREFSHLLSNHSYNLYVDFTYLSNGEEIADWVAIKGITTAAKTEPAVTFRDLSVTNTQVIGNIHMEDVDAIGKITAVELYQNDRAVQNNTVKELNFSGLDSYTQYRVIVTYTFDLNEGEGLQTKTATYDFTTAPSLTFKSCTVANTSIVDQGQTIYLQININNPNEVVYKKIVVNGRQYDVVRNSSTTTMLYCEIVNNGQFKGGNTTLEVEKVIAELGGKTYTIEPKVNNTAKVLILGKKPEVESIQPVVLEKGEYVEKNYFFPEEQAYLKITLSEKTECQIDFVVVNGETYSNLIKLDDIHYLFAFSMERHISEMTLTEVGYSQGDYSNTLHIGQSCRVVNLQSKEVHYISTPDDLLNMHSGVNYYELTGDIDLSGLEWRGNDFLGVLNGKGYAIKNMSYIGSVGSASKGKELFGLFSRATGVIENLKLENMQFIVKPEGTEADIYFGGIAADCFYAVISDCTVDERSFVNVDSDSVGGIAGWGGTYRNCVNYGTISGSERVGGIAGDGGTYKNCANYGSISGNENVGGIAGDGGTYKNCANYGSISGNENVGGIGGYGGTYKNCANYGSISGDENVGGIVGSMYSATIKNAINLGNASRGGIALWLEASTIEASVNYGRISGGSHESNLVGDSDKNSSITNCYDNATVEQLNSKTFYTETLGWSEDVWSFDGLDIEKGGYPTLRGVRSGR